MTITETGAGGIAINGGSAGASFIGTVIGPDGGTWSVSGERDYLAAGTAVSAPVGTFGSVSTTGGGADTTQPSRTPARLLTATTGTAAPQPTGANFAGIRRRRLRVVDGHRHIGSLSLSFLVIWYTVSRE